MIRMSAFLVALLALSGCNADDSVVDPPPVELCPENSQLAFNDIEVGTSSRAVVASDNVRIAYTGRLLDGSQFDASQNFEVALSGAIAGLRQGMVGMRVGGRRLITVPPNLGYATIPQAQIPACSTLLFEVTLLEIR